MAVQYHCDACEIDFSVQSTFSRHMRNLHDFALDTVMPTQQFMSDIQPKDLRPLYQEHWGRIRSYHRRGAITSTYNFRLDDLNPTTMARNFSFIYNKEKSAFKMNLAFGMVLRDVATGELRYFVINH
jgi:hypothetical protein